MLSLLKLEEGLFSCSSCTTNILVVFVDNIVDVINSADKEVKA